MSKVQVILKSSPQNAWIAVSIANRLKSTDTFSYLVEEDKHKIKEQLDTEAEVVLMVGYSFKEQSDPGLREFLTEHFDVPFSECYWVTPYGEVLQNTGINFVTTQDNDSLIGNLNSTLNNSAFFEPVESDEVVEAIHSYYTWTWEGKNMSGVYLMELYRLYGTGLIELYQHTSIKSMLSQNLELLKNALAKRNHYIQTHSSGSYISEIKLGEDQFVTFGVIEAEDYINDVASSLMGTMASYYRVALVVSSTNHYDTRISIRSQHVNCLEIARILDPSAQGKPQAASVFLRLPNQLQQVVDTLANLATPNINSMLN